MKTLVEYCKEQFEFTHFSENMLYYKSPDGFLVRIRIGDLDGSRINATEKGMTLMKWIREELKGIGTE